MTPARLALPLLALAVMAACGSETKTGPERRTAAGEVLGGSITDDMLPLDTVRSQSPPLREDPVASEAEIGDDGARAGPATRKPARAAPPATGTAASAPPSPPAETPEAEPE